MKLFQNFLHVKLIQVIATSCLFWRWCGNVLAVNSKVSRGKLVRRMKIRNTTNFIKIIMSTGTFHGFKLFSVLLIKNNFFVSLSNLISQLWCINPLLPIFILVNALCQCFLFVVQILLSMFWHCIYRPKYAMTMLLSRLIFIR